MDQDQINGYVEHIVYRNDQNGYTVFSFVADEEEITCVGHFPSISEGECFSLTGSYTEHVTYGRQFKVESHEVSEMVDSMSLERYLGSGAIRGVGPTLAARIVKRFGKDTIRIIEEEPERLAEIKGISMRIAMEISDQMEEKRDIRNAMIFMEKYGIHGNLAMKVYQEYKEKVYSVITENPYRMADEISGLGFKTADEIARRVGISVDSDFRIRSGIMYALTLASTGGHTYLPRQQLVDYCANLLGLDAGDIEPHVMNLIMEKKLISENDGQRVYSAMMYRMEEACAIMLHRINEDYATNEDQLEGDIEWVEKEEHIRLDEKQRQAIKSAAGRGLFVLTGGPGTGKTTTIRGMIAYFQREGYEVELAAPTGRAAKRMSEATGHEARTIHRLLEVNGLPGDDDKSQARFERNQFNPLEADVVIIDEVSMVDIYLLYALLLAIGDGTRLILVGDNNQLPSVGPGNVLGDIIASRCFNVITLDKIFRQAAESDIVVNAHRINKGDHFEIDNKSRDFFMLKRTDGDQIISVLLTLIRDKLPGYVEAESFDIQVLTPTRKGVLGVERLNTILQQYLNPPAEDKPEWESGSRIFRLGDKVMQIKNNYQLEWEVCGRYGMVIDKGTGVFNGDMGVVDCFDRFAGTMTVRFDEGRTVEYHRSQLDELELAYAVTIHKSQGSEYPAVIIPLLPGPQMLMNRNLLYTAVTRAKKCVTIVGDEAVLWQMVDNASQGKRYSGLINRIVENLV